MPPSLSQINLRGTRPSCWISSHEACSGSSVVLVGIIRPTMNLECAAVITSTGNNLAVPSSSGIFFGGNQRSHCAASPGSQVSRSAGSIGPELRPHPLHPSPEPGDRPRPTDPLREHRRGHVRSFLQQRPHP